MTLSGTDSVSARSFESLARDAAAQTLQPSRLERMDVEYVEESAGLSAGVWQLFGDRYLGMCGEGVGTKNALIEELVAALNSAPWPGVDPYTYYYNIAIDGVAMIVNDLITLGVLPCGMIQILDLFGKDWHANQVRKEAVVNGWRDGCIAAGVHWSGGETAELNTVRSPHLIMGGACWGLVPERHKPTLPSSIRLGDEIVLVASSGVHSNGLTGLRKLCAKLGFDHILPDGRRFAEVLLTPTAIYVNGIEACFDAGVNIRHSVHLTGGGLSRLNRNSPPVCYVITERATPSWEFLEIKKHTGASTKEMLETYNGGQGLAVIVAPDHGERAIAAFQGAGHEAWITGQVEEDDHHRVILTSSDDPIEWTEVV